MKSTIETKVLPSLQSYCVVETYAYSVNQKLSFTVDNMKDAKALQKALSLIDFVESAPIF